MASQLIQCQPLQPNFTLATYCIITPRRVCASGVKQSVLSVVVVVVVVCHKKFSLMGDLEAKTISKQEDKDEIRRILAYVYLIEHKAVLFSIFFFLIVHHFC